MGYCNETRNEDYILQECYIIIIIIIIIISSSSIQPLG
jgi:hypothetical protein